MLQDKGHCWLSRTCRTGAFLGATYYLLPYCICRPLSALLCKSYVTGFGLFVNLPEACEFPACPSACHSLIANFSILLSTCLCPDKPPFKSRVCGAVPALQPWAWGSSSSSAFLTHSVGTGGCCLPASCVWDLLWARVGSPSGPGFVLCDQQ